MSLALPFVSASLSVMLLAGTSHLHRQATDEIPFGGTFEGKRSSVSLSQPEAFTPSESALAEKGRAVKTTVTLVNKGTDVMESFDFSATATCGGVAAPMIYDLANGFSGSSPPGDILPGRTMKWPLGFAVTAEPCEMIVTMSYGGDSVYFVGRI